MTRTEAVEALLSGARTPSELARELNVAPSEVAEWLVAAERSRRAARRRLTAAGVLASCVVFALAGRVAFSAGTCAQTLPSPLVTFCPDEPAMASEVNGNFAGVLSLMNARIGPGDAGVIAVNSVEATSAVGTLTLQTSGATTRVGGPLQLVTNTTAPCNATTAGSLRARGSTLEFCVANVWRQVPTGNPGSPASCLSLLTATPGLPNGVYSLTAGGYTFQAECDMTGGGWTLIQAHNTDRTLESLGVISNSGTYLPAAAVRQLAANSTQVRFADSAGSATSVANDTAIIQLRQLLTLNISAPTAATWSYTGNLTAGNFTASCPTPNTYPSIIHTCGNSNGAHVFPDTHSLRGSASVREVSNVWVK